MTEAPAQTLGHLGLIQTRGLGDIIVALPIAHWLITREGWQQISWPVQSEWVDDLERAIPWINWIGVDRDPSGRFFYDEPMRLLSAAGADQCLPLYQALTGHPEFSASSAFQIQSFDQHKYHVAGVPFDYKWRAFRDDPRLISRDPERERALKDLALGGDTSTPWITAHLEGSDGTRTPLDPALIPEGHRLVEIRPIEGYSLFDWLGVIESSQAFVGVDSVWVNLIDQLGWPQTDLDCYFIPRSHIQLTPVLAGPWTIIEPDAAVAQRITIFRTG